MTNDTNVKCCPMNRHEQLGKKADCDAVDIYISFPVEPAISTTSSGLSSVPWRPRSRMRTLLIYILLVQIPDELDEAPPEMGGGRCAKLFSSLVGEPDWTLRCAGTAPWALVHPRRVNWCPWWDGSW
jgi:hypothetical protein